MTSAFHSTEPHSSFGGDSRVDSLSVRNHSWTIGSFSFPAVQTHSEARRMTTELIHWSAESLTHGPQVGNDQGLMGFCHDRGKQRSVAPVWVWKHWWSASTLCFNDYKVKNVFPFCVGLSFLIGPVCECVDWYGECLQKFPSPHFGRQIRVMWNNIWPVGLVRG